MAKTRVVYRDIAPGAAEDATVTVTEGMGSPKTLPFGTNPGPLITLERSRWLLDGSCKDFIPHRMLGFGLRIYPEMTVHLRPNQLS